MSNNIPLPHPQTNAERILDGNNSKSAKIVIMKYINKIMNLVSDNSNFFK